LEKRCFEGSREVIGLIPTMKWLILLLCVNNLSFISGDDIRNSSTASGRQLRTTGHNNGKQVFKGESGGQWTAATHLGIYGLNIDAGLMTVLERACETAEKRLDAIISTTTIKEGQQGSSSGRNSCKVLEFGCGVGVYVNYLKSQDPRRVVVGMEPEPMGGVFSRPDGPVQSTVNILEIQTSPKSPDDYFSTLVHALGGPFHLVYSIEVAEHIPKDRHADVAAWLYAAADPKGSTLIFSAGHPGQKGTGHIGNRDRSEWKLILEKAGWVLDNKATFDGMRTADRVNKNHQQNIMVLVRR